jgi:hypothetical protein
MKRSKILILALLLVVSAVMLQPASAVDPMISEYTSYPIFQLTAVAPNIFDHARQLRQHETAGHRDLYDRSPTKNYYGYFEPHRKYAYGSGVFVRNDAGLWDGNFLN